MNTSLTRRIALALSLCLTPLAASAGEGFYLGASIGSANLDDDFDGLKIDDNVTAYRLVGGWRMNRYAALEAGYQNFGDFEQRYVLNGLPGSAKLSADGYTFAVAGSYPLFEKLDVTGRIGAFFWDGEADINNVSQASPEDTNLFFGLGISYALGDNFVLTSDWRRYELESANSDVFSVGFEYHFGR